MKKLGSFVQIGTIGWVDHSISACTQQKPATKEISLYDRFGMELEHITAIEPVDVSEFLTFTKSLQESFHKKATNLLVDARIEAREYYSENCKIEFIVHEQVERRVFKAPEHLSRENLEEIFQYYPDVYTSKSIPIFVSLAVYESDGVFSHYHSTFAFAIDKNCKMSTIVWAMNSLNPPRPLI